MNRYATSSLLILLAVLGTACGANATATEAVSLSNVYTAAAETLAAGAMDAAPTATAMTFATSTRVSLPMTVPVTVTPQSVVSYSSASTANGCDNSVFVSDVTISDGTVLAPGESFVKTWEFQNSGTCAWSEDYMLTFMSGDDMDGEDTAIDVEVSTGETADLSVTLVAPSTEGTYTGYWRLADEDGNVFGQSVYVMIVVSNDAATTTPTLTPTSTTEAMESTSTPEPTATVTSTPVPTAAPTKTEESTPTEATSS